MPEKLEKCYHKVKAQLISRGKSEKDADDIARGTCVKTTGLQWRHEDFNTPLRITEVAKIQTEKGRYHYFAGIAIAPGISKNFMNYRAEELEKSYQSLEDKRMFPNHDITKPPIGKVVFAGLNEDKSVPFVVEIDDQVDPAVAASVESGYIDHVSIGANPKSFECDICHEEWKSQQCHHYMLGQKYKTSDGKEELCTVAPRDIEYEELTAVFFKAGIDRAVIQQTADALPVIMEKLNEIKLIKRQQNMEKDEIIQLKVKEAKAQEELASSTKAKESLESQNKTLLSEVENLKKKHGDMEKRILGDKIIELAKKEVEAFPDRYKPEDVPKRIDQIKADHTIATIETIGIRITVMDEKIAENQSKHISSPPVGRAFGIPPANPNNKPTDQQQKQEMKRLTEIALNFPYPIKKEVKEEIEKNGFIFGKREESEI